MLFYIKSFVIAEGGEEFVVSLKQKVRGRKITDEIPNLFQGCKILANYSELHNKNNDLNNIADKTNWIGRKIDAPKDDHSVETALKLTVLNDSCPVAYKGSDPASYISPSIRMLDSHPQYFPIVRTFKTKKLRKYEEREPFDMEVFVHDNYFYLNAQEWEQLAENERNIFKKNGILFNNKDEQFIFDNHFKTNGCVWDMTWDEAKAFYHNRLDKLGKSQIPTKSQMTLIVDQKELLDKLCKTFYGYSNFLRGETIWTIDIASYDKKGNPETIWCFDNWKITPQPLYYDKKRKSKNKNRVYTIYAPRTKKQY